MQCKLFWVGPRKSDIAHVEDVNFYGSITIFGDGKDNNYAYCLTPEQNRVNHNVSDKEEDLFFYHTIKGIIEKEENVRFYFYNPNAVYYIEGLEEYSQYFLCLNEKSLMRNTNNKAYFQKILNGNVPLLDRKFDKFHRNNSDYLSLVSEFKCDPKSDTRFIFQAPVSSGGNGTFLIDSRNIKDAVNQLVQDNYIISIYEEKNIPLNIHAIIFDEEIVLSPGSVQIIREDDDRLLYRGADFITYRSIKEEIRIKFEDNVRKACKIFQSSGYRGVCGIDGMICGDRVFLLELNNRFQASTSLIDLAASYAGLPSLQKINIAAFNNDWDEDFRAIEKLEVNFSNYFYTDNGTGFHCTHIRNVYKKLSDEGELKKAHIFSIEEDGFDAHQRTNSLAYLYRMVFDTNITAINAEGCIQINENICEPLKSAWYDKFFTDEKSFSCYGASEIRDFYLRLKIALLVQGVVLDKGVLERFDSCGGIRPATNNAIDIRIDIPTKEANRFEKYLIINAPTDIKFVEFSPFIITAYKKDKFILLYYGKEITEISRIFPADFLAQKSTVATADKPSVPYSEIAFLSTDRLRVHLTNFCEFKKHGKGCQFCNIKPSMDVMDLRNVEEVVADYCKNGRDLGLTHFLVGGQTAPESDSKKIIDIIKIIRKHAKYADIYAMVIPYSKEMIREMYRAGMNQLSCNIEVFDEELALKYMPGKRQKTESDYIETLSYATTLMGRSGNVRSMVIVGLEPMSGLIKGITKLVENGIQPILSVFRPLPDTPLENSSAPSMLSLYQLYLQVQEICKKHQLLLGPECINCQNNTLALPYWMEI